MKKTGRNAPCPCGSGKKYKLCCLELKREETSPADLLSRGWVMVEDDIDRDSNRVVDLLDEGRIGEAERAAAILFEKYPDMSDGHERTAQVLEAKGERKRAAEHYRAAAEILHAQDPEYSRESVEYLRGKASEMEADQPLDD
jgi:hypothetical protein